MRVAITRSAEIDLLEGFSFYEEQATGIGDYFIDSLVADIDSLALFGSIHPKPEGSYYRTVAKRFPFAIYYAMEDDLVTVVAVLDCRQNPASITDRLLKT